MEFDNEQPITSVSADKLGGLFGLNRTDSGFGLFVLGVIVPIPPHTGSLINIPLRSMLINGGVPLLKDSQPYRSGTSFNTTSTGTY
jgi:hypothetical protein